MKTQFPSTFRNPFNLVNLGAPVKVALYLLLVTVIWSCQNPDKSDQTSAEVVASETDNNANNPRSGAEQLPELPDEPSASVDAQLSTSPPASPASEPSPVTEDKDDRDQQEQAKLLRELTEINKREKQEMLREKDRAEEAGGDEFASGLMDQAREKEKSADRSANGSTRQGLLNAQLAYREAASNYRLAATQAAENKAATQMTKAQDAQNQMLRSKNTLNGTAEELQQLREYQEGLQIENQGNQQLLAKEFIDAENSFNTAEGHFSRASNELAELKAKTAAARRKQESKPTPPPGPSEEEIARKREEAEKVQRQRLAERRIKAMQNDYRSKLETKDLTGLVAAKFINRDEQDQWSLFFRTIKEFTVRIEGSRFNFQNNQAVVDFRVKLSYTNKSNGKQIGNEVGRTWKLTDNNGNWRLLESIPTN